MSLSEEARKPVNHCKGRFVSFRLGETRPNELGEKRLRVPDAEAQPANSLGRRETGAVLFRETESPLVQLRPLPTAICHDAPSNPRDPTTCCDHAEGQRHNRDESHGKTNEYDYRERCRRDHRADDGE